MLFVYPLAAAKCSGELSMSSLIFDKTCTAFNYTCSQSGLIKHVQRIIEHVAKKYK